MNDKESIEHNARVWDEYSESKKSREDFGKLHLSATGSKRFNDGKPEVSQLDPRFILDLANLLTISARKYGKNNWRLGQNYSTPFDSCMRHMLSFMDGENLDSESNLNHLLHAAANIMIMYDTFNNHSELDDRYKND